MFNCTRRPSKKVKEKVDFRIQFHATQVPHTAWDKLAVSLISLDTGRVTGKTRKVSVRNGHCQWPDAVAETTKLLLDIRTLQYDEKLYKFVVAKGFSRSCILGEVIINISDYVSAASPTSMTLPLRFCYAGTLLHVTIQCLTPKSTAKPFHWLNSRKDELMSDAESDISANATPLHPCVPTTSVGSQSPTATSANGECSRMQPPSPVASHVTEKKSGMIAISYISLSSTATTAVTTPTRTAKSPGPTSRALSIDPELHVEAAYQWKQYAEKLQDDLEVQKLKLANTKLEADFERTSFLEERDDLKEELKQMKKLNEELVAKGTVICEEHICVIEELKQALKSEKETNTSLTSQLQKLKDSNMELLLAVRDLEDLLEEHAKGTEHLLNCKVYNNPCAEGDATMEEGFSESSYAAETKDKNIDKILDLNRKESGMRSSFLDRLEQVMGEKAPKFKIYISTFMEDLLNMRAVLDEMGKQPEINECYTSTNDQLITDLKALLEGCRSLISELQKKKNDAELMTEDLDNVSQGGESPVREVKAADSLAGHLVCDCQLKYEDELNQQSTQLKEMDSRVMELVMEKAKLEDILNGYMDQEEARNKQLDQLEEQTLQIKEMDAKVMQLMLEKNELDGTLKGYRDQEEAGKKNIQRIEEQSLQLRELDSRMMQIMLEKAKLETTLKGYMEQEDARKKKMDQLECQVLEFAKELDYMQESNEELESVLLSTKSEKEHLEQMVKDANAGRQNLQLLSQKIAALEAEVKSMEEEKEAYFLEKCVAENLARDLCEQLQTVLKSNDDGELARSGYESENESQWKEQKQDFIGHVKELRSFFSLLLKMTQESEDRMRQFQCTCNFLEGRMLKENEKVMATIAFLDDQFGQLSKESDQMLDKCNEEVEMVLSKLEQEYGGEKPNSHLLRLALEENGCEIAYLRDEIRRLKEQISTLTQEKEDLKVRATADTQKLEAESEELQAEYRQLQEKCQQLEVSNTELTAALSQGHREVETLNIELATLHEALESVKSDKSSLERLLSADEEKLRETAEQHAHEVIEWQKRLQNLQEKLNRSETEVASSRLKTQEVLDELRAQKAELENMMETLQDLKSEKISLEFELEKRQGQDAAAQTIIAAMETELEYSKGSIKTLEQDMISFQMKLQSEGELREAARVECVQLTRSNEELRLRLSERSAAIDQKLLDLQKRLEVKLCYLQTELESLHKYCEIEGSLFSEKLEEAYKQTKISNDAVVLQMDQLKHLNHKLEQNAQDLEMEVEAKSRVETEVKRECQSLKNEIEDFKRRLSELKKEKEEAIVHSQNLQKLILELELNEQSRKLEVEQKQAKQAEAATQTEYGNLDQTTELKLKSQTISTSVQKRINQLEMTRDGALECDLQVKDFQDIKNGRRKWKQHHQDDQEPELKSLRAKIASLEIVLNSKTVHPNSSVDKSREREAVLCEKIVQLETSKRQLEEEAALRRTDSEVNKLVAELGQCKLAKSTLEGNISRLKSELQTVNGLLAETEKECERLKNENKELKTALSDWEEQKIKLARVEAEAHDLRGTVACKEAEASSKALELEALKQELQDREAFLWKKIEYLETANEQLQEDSGVDQLKKELTRLQNQNSELTRRERELTSKLSAYELLQLELQRLQEDNEQLEQKYLKLKDASLWGDTLDRLVYLETELSEALETNNMYKLQLQNVFSKQNVQNVQNAALRDLGDVEEIINNLVSFKKQTSFLETELKEMQERYLNMSMRFAELQSEREELHMTVKALKCSR